MISTGIGWPRKGTLNWRAAALGLVPIGEMSPSTDRLIRKDFNSEASMSRDFEDGGCWQIANGVVSLAGGS